VYYLDNLYVVIELRSATLLRLSTYGQGRHLGTEIMSQGSSTRRNFTHIHYLIEAIMHQLSSLSLGESSKQGSMCITRCGFIMDNRKRGRPLKSKLIVNFAEDGVPSKKTTARGHNPMPEVLSKLSRGRLYGSTRNSKNTIRSTISWLVIA
jgi:hypothetical protein